MAGSAPLKLPPATPTSGPLQFEVYNITARDRLRTLLVAVVDRCSQSWRFLSGRSVLPQLSIKNKLPYQKEALEHPERAVKLTGKQRRAIRLHNAIAGNPPDVSFIRARPKRARDAFGPGMVFMVNTVLAWLMFSIDVRNAMLK